MQNDIIRAVADSIREGNDFLVVSHVNPEGDAVGSQLAMGGILRALGKNYVLVNADEVPGNILFLPEVRTIKRVVPGSFNPGAVIVLDCPVAVRCGNLTEYLYSAGKVINIDHHLSNDGFGDVNWNEPEKSSVGEMVFELARYMGVDIDKRMAVQIYTAIVTDTGMFSYSNTAPSTHDVAAELLRAGADHVEVHRRIFETRSLQQVELLGKVLTTLELACQGRVAHISLMHQMFAGRDIRDIPTDEFITFPRSIKGVEVALFFKETGKTPTEVKVSFRSDGAVDVNSIAGRFGGGGHRLAAGCTVEGVLADVKREVLSQVERGLTEAGVNDGTP